MTVAHQIASRNSLAALKANPAVVLANNIINADDAGGHMTRRETAWYGAHGNNIRVGSSGFCRNTNAMMNFTPIQLSLLLTPTRGRATPTRQNQLQRVNAGNVDLWTTTQQTGCTVLILNWGGQQYSMVHLQPYGAAEYNRVSRAVLPTNTPRGARFAASYLRTEATTIVNNSTIGGVQPVRYILVQSNRTYLAGGRIQIIGVPNAGNFNFYVQARNNAGVINLIQPQWQNWRWYQSYQAVTN